MTFIAWEPRYKKQSWVKYWAKVGKRGEIYISFSSCFLMNSLECAVTLSVLLHSINRGIFFFTTIAFVNISYKYLWRSTVRIRKENTWSAKVKQKRLHCILLPHLYQSNTFVTFRGQLKLNCCLKPQTLPTTKERTRNVQHKTNLFFLGCHWTIYCLVHIFGSRLLEETCTITIIKNNNKK